MDKIKKLIRYLFSSRLKEVPFIIFLSFLLTFSFTRAYLYLSHKDVMELPNAVIINGAYFHHLSFGIVILAIVGYLAVLDIKPVVHRTLAIIYGIGLGLTFDEFGMWFGLNQDYYSQLTYDALVILSLILLNVVYFPLFWNRMGRQIFKILRRFYRLFHFLFKLIFRKFASR